jgi:hypothetical protein
MAGGLSGFRHLKERSARSKEITSYHTKAFGVFHHVFKVKNLVHQATFGLCDPPLITLDSALADG